MKLHFNKSGIFILNQILQSAKKDMHKSRKFYLEY